MAYLGGHSPAYPAPHPIDDPNWWRRYRNAYFRMIEMVDAQIGIVLESLRFGPVRRHPRSLHQRSR